ncbi:MAG: hypothetical protein R3B48_12470 [Kofleriaceae bacterium]
MQARGPRELHVCAHEDHISPARSTNPSKLDGGLLMRPWMIALSIATALALPSASQAQTVQDVLAKNLAARGGQARVAALQSLRTTGKVVFGGRGFSVEAEVGMLQKRPGSMRLEVTLQGLTQINAYDGREGWTISPFQGRREAERQSADDARGLAQQADLDGPLIGWQRDGHRVELLGTEDVDGTPALKLRVNRKDGDLQYIYLDPDTYLEIRATTVQRVRGAETITETDYGAYQQVAGVWFPFSVESGQQGQPRNFRLTIERIEANVTVDDALFRFPAAGSPRSIVAGPGLAPIVPVAAPPLHDARVPVIDSGAISGLGARNIGSAAMSGRVSAVAAHLEDGKVVVYVGSASGGVWKSRDGGTTFKPIFDKNPVQSIGAITIDPSNSKIIWVGTGEAWTRNSTSVGDGIYKSTDGGETWTHMGLRESERIVRIVVHPRDSSVVYACVPGKLWSDSSERGLYRSADGGKTWVLALKGGNLSTGCSSVALDPKNPNVVLAGLWDFRRKGWTFRSGGEGPTSASGSGMYRSVDGGRSFSALTARTAKGLPEGPWGRVEIAYAPSDSKIVYALIESTKSALYRSGDGGATWEARDRSQMMVWRPFYFARLVVDPTNPNRVFKPNLSLIVSEDGGRSFSNTGGGAHGDWHDLWINPQNPKHIIGGDDGGLFISYDGGNRWHKSNNLPISQFYHVSVDNKDPYQVYGGLQDNSSWVGDSEYPGGITNSRWENLYGGDGFWTLVDPTDPDAVYAESQGGYIGRVDRKTLTARDIQPKPGYREKLRFNWNAPIYLSPTQKGTLYLGAQFLFRSRDRGNTWERISPDLTTNDPAKQQQELSGGITVDNSSAEMHTTIFSISESPRNAAVIWVGTDDGNLQLTRNGGKSWSNVVGNVPGLPKHSWVSWVEASRYNPAVAYAAFDRHTFGDLDPWVYKTTNYGATWTRLVSPAQGVRGYAYVIKEDTLNSQLLFLGTEFGLWISLDGGARWAQFKGGDFPSVSVREVQIHPRDHDLIIGTHGRGIWIVDDLTPLRALTSETLLKQTAFLPSRPVQQRMQGNGGWVEGDATFVGENPAGGVEITYYLRTRHIFGSMKLEILDASGKLIDTVAATKRRGINRVVWSARVPPPTVPKAAQLAFSATSGPRVVPGTYTLRMTRGAEVVERKFTLGLDRRAKFTVADRRAQFAAVMKAHALFGEMNKLVTNLDATRAALLARAAALPANDALATKLRAAAGRLEETKKQIVATKEGGAITGEERIREHLDNAYGAINRWEGRPARYQVERVEVLRRELADVKKEFDGIVARDVRALDGELKSRKLEPIPAVGALSAPVELDRLAVSCVRSLGASCEPEAGSVAAD